MADVLWNVPFKKFLQFHGYFAKPLATHFVIPCYHFPTVPLFGIGFYPIGYSLVFSARGHKLLEGVRSADTPDFLTRLEPAYAGLRCSGYGC